MSPTQQGRHHGSPVRLYCAIASSNGRRRRYQVSERNKVVRWKVAEAVEDRESRGKERVAACLTRLVGSGDLLQKRSKPPAILTWPKHQVALLEKFGSGVTPVKHLKASRVVICIEEADANAIFVNMVFMPSLAK